MTWVCLRMRHGNPTYGPFQWYDDKPSRTWASYESQPWIGRSLDRFHLWGQGCEFGVSAVQVLCFHQGDTKISRSGGFWPVLDPMGFFVKKRCCSVQHFKRIQVRVCIHWWSKKTQTPRDILLCAGAYLGAWFQDLLANQQWNINSPARLCWSTSTPTLSCAQIWRRRNVGFVMV